MKKYIFLILFLAGTSYAQNTVVSATIKNQSGQVYANGTWKVDFFPTPGIPGPYTQQGTPFTQHFSGALDSTGSFTVTLASTISIVPGNSKWTFTVCPNATFSCTSTSQTINGTTLDMSANISAYLPPSMIDINPLPNFNSAYSNLSMGPPFKLVDGSAYFNTTSGKPCWFYHGAWECLSTGTGGGPIPINELLNATGTNSINNGDFDQNWNWSLTGTNAVAGLAIAENAPSTNTNPNSVLFAVATRTNSTITPFSASAQDDVGGIKVAANGDVQATGTAHFIAPFRATNITGLTQCVQADPSGNLTGSGLPCGSSVGQAVPINLLLNATGPNDITSSNFTQAWRWLLTGTAPEDGLFIAEPNGQFSSNTGTNSALVGIGTHVNSTVAPLRAIAHSGPGLMVNPSGNVQAIAGAIFQGPLQATDITGPTCVQADATGKLSGSGVPCNGLNNLATGTGGGIAIWQTGATCSTLAQADNVCTSTFNVPNNPFRNSFMLVCSPGAIGTGFPTLVEAGPFAVNPTNQILVAIRNGGSNNGAQVSSYQFLTCFAFGT